MEELNKNTEKLASQLERLGIKKFYLTGAGNSLMSGYSTIFKTTPLFKRNTNLTAIFAKHDIDVIATHFARTQNNNDEHIYHYFSSNISEREMYRYNRIDNLKLDTPVVDMTEEETMEYYPENPTPNYHFKDSILTEEKDRANVLVYIGATGSFLDNITRGGFPKIISGFKRDFISISATLKEIKSSNRHNSTNTEVYLVGIPRYMNTPVTDILINRHLKEIAANYANVTYVEPIKAKLFYGLKPDVHLSPEEYLDLNNSIMESINDNYISVMAMIEIDRFLFNLNEIILSQVSGKILSNFYFINNITGFIVFILSSIFILKYINLNNQSFWNSCFNIFFTSSISILCIIFFFGGYLSPFDFYFTNLFVFNSNISTFFIFVEQFIWLLIKFIILLFILIKMYNKIKMYNISIKKAAFILSAIGILNFVVVSIIKYFSTGNI